jgi:hypothetical protein
VPARPGAWAATSVTSERRGSSRSQPLDPRWQAFWAVERWSLLFVEPPEHTRVRAARRGVARRLPRARPPRAPLRLRPAVLDHADLPAARRPDRQALVTRGPQLELAAEPEKYRLAPLPRIRPGVYRPTSRPPSVGWAATGSNVRPRAVKARERLPDGPLTRLFKAESRRRSCRRVPRPGGGPCARPPA